MADAAVEFVLNNLKDLLLYHSDIITGYEKQIENLEIDLRCFSAFLQESQKMRRKDEGTKELVRNIRDVVFEVEGVLDAFVTQALEKKASPFVNFWKPSVTLHTIGKMLEDVKGKIERARSNYASRSVLDEEKYEKPEARPPRQKYTVGFADMAEELIQRLTKESDYFDVVCLIGMPGLGKTTLAWKIFNDEAIMYKFRVRIWLSISSNFSDKDIFISMLEQFTTITDHIRQKGDKEIARMVAAYLEKGNFLVVMDDVWATSDWDRLRDALPNHNNKGKILITSRSSDVGEYACKPRPPYQLRFLTRAESWELLQLEAFGNLDCPPELVDIGKLIARDCRGSPHAIVTVGGILAAKYSESDLNATRRAWHKVSMQVSSYIHFNGRESMNHLIALSYDKLPYHLRACFLYLGIFPADYEIPASKLILMWIGEGFIQQSNDSSLEEIGEKYLEDLINRNLVHVEKIKPDGMVKTCRIHDTVRDFCRTEAQHDNENLPEEIKFDNGGFSPPISDLHKYRRLCLHSNCLQFISSKPFGPRVRSFVCFSKDKVILPPENIPDILKAFKLIRVLDVKPIIFPNVNCNLFQLVHLRYLVLSFNISTLHSKFNRLRNLQTLIVNTTSRTLNVRADIWKLIQLRHFITNASASLPKPTKDSKYGFNLQTLGTISVESCTAELFQRASNLKKLGICGQLSLLLEGKEGSFESLGRMKYLENLELINDLYSQPLLDGKLRTLPQPNQFPSNLKSLTLRATFLDWSNMSILGLLEKLEVLKLKDKAFMGNAWEAEDGGFRHLEFLHIEVTDLAIWTASSHHYPSLRGLVLRNCEKLLEIPMGLADIGTFQMLELNMCKSAVASAERVEEAKRKAQTAFRLSVFSPTD